MSTTKFFCWKDAVAVEYGASRAAIYNFDTGEVFSLNVIARRLIEQIDQQPAISTLGADAQIFLSALVEVGLGEFRDTPRATSRLIEAPLTVPLRFISLELTEACNLGCVHCYANVGTHKSAACSGATTSVAHEIPLHSSPIPALVKTPSSPRMQEADWIRVIDEAAALGCKQLQLIGGEPLLYRPLFKLIDAACAAGYEVIELFTNGTLLTEERTQALADRGVRVAVSVHGSRAEIHDPIAQQAGAFDRMAQGLHLLQKHQVSTRAATSVLYENQDDVENIIHWLHSIGVAATTYDIVRAVGRGQTVDRKLTNEDVLRSKWLYEADFVTSRESYLHNRFWHSCWAGQISVTSQGYITPCIMGRDQVIGNVQKETLAEVLQSQRLQQFWGLTKDQVAICRDCEYRYACHDCRPLALGETGDLYAKYPRCIYDPYRGTWQSIPQVLHTGDQPHVAEAADNRVPSHEVAILVDDEVDHDENPEVVLVTHHKISVKELYQRLTCGPQGPYVYGYETDSKEGIGC